MKKHTTKLAASPPPILMSKTPHELRPNQDKPLPHPKPKTRDNIFSKSRDLRRIAARAK